MLRRVGIVAAVLALATALAACTAGASSPAPDATVASTHARSATATPGATSTPGAGAADAYLAYIDAASHFDSANPATLADILSRSSQAQHTADTTLYGQLATEKWSIRGGYRVTLLTLKEATTSSALLDVCLDVSDLRFVDQAGAERVPPGDQDKVQSVSITMIRDGAANPTWLVAKTTPRQGEPRCV